MSSVSESIQQLFQTQSEREILAGLTFTSPDLIQFQKDHQTQLAEELFTGDFDTIPDVHAAFELNPSDYVVYEYGEGKKRKAKIRHRFIRNKTIYESSSWFNAIRLALARGNRFLGYVSVQIPILLKNITAWCGLSYLLSFIYDAGVVLKNTFSPMKAFEKNISPHQRRWRRFKTSLFKGERIHRIGNDLVWGVINAVVLFAKLSTRLAGAIGLVTFVFDVFNEIFKLGDYLKHRKLLKKAKAQLTHIQNRLVIVNTKLNNFPPIKSLKERNAYETLRVRRDAYEAQLPHSLAVYESLNNKTNEILFHRGRKIVCTTFLAVGMGLVLGIFNPALPILIAAAAVVFVTGSVLNGLGEKLYRSGVLGKITGVGKKIIHILLPFTKKLPVPDNQHSFSPLNLLEKKKNVHIQNKLIMTQTKLDNGQYLVATPPLRRSISINTTASPTSTTSSMSSSSDSQRHESSSPLNHFSHFRMTRQYSSDSKLALLKSSERDFSPTRL